MNAEWHFFTERTPPEEVILLVTGPLGVDLAIRLEGNLFFKKGDEWSPSNLEHWSNNIPIQWAEFTLPDRDSDFALIPLEHSGEPSVRK